MPGDRASPAMPRRRRLCRPESPIVCQAPTGTPGTSIRVRSKTAGLDFRACPAAASRRRARAPSVPSIGCGSSGAARQTGGARVTQDFCVFLGKYIVTMRCIDAHQIRSLLTFPVLVATLEAAHRRPKIEVQDGFLGSEAEQYFVRHAVDRGRYFASKLITSFPANVAGGRLPAV